MKLAAFLALTAFSGTAEATEPVTVISDGLSVEAAIKSNCSGPIIASVRDDEAGRRILFGRAPNGRPTVAAMWRAPINYEGWKPRAADGSAIGAFHVEMASNSTDADVMAISECMAFLFAPPINVPTVIHR